MKRRIIQWTLTMVFAISLVACATSARYASTNDDIYYSPSKIEQASIATSTVTSNQDKDAEIQQLRRETQIAIQESAQRIAADSTLIVVENDNSYSSIVSDSYEDSYERRLRGYSSPSYGMESVIRITTSSDWMQVSSFDPAFYNIIIMGDEVWVEPKYVTNMFSPVRMTVNLGWGYGNYWNSWNYPYYSFGGYNSWYSPWGWSSWNYPYYGSYWGWGYGYNYGWGWNCGWNGNWGHGHYYSHHDPHWGLGRPSVAGNTYGRRTSGTMTHNRLSTASGNNGSQRITGGTRRTARNMEVVSSGRTQQNGSAVTNAGNRRGNTVQQDVNTSGTVRRDTRNNGTRTAAQSGATSTQSQTSRRNSQVYTRPTTTNRQSYNQSQTTGSTARRSITGSSTNTGSTRMSTSSQGSSGRSSRSVSTPRYSTGSSSSGNNSSSVSRRSSSSSSSSYSPSSSSSRSSSSYSPSSSSSTRSSGSSGGYSGGSSSSSGGGGRRR